MHEDTRCVWQTPPRKTATLAHDHESPPWKTGWTPQRCAARVIYEKCRKSYLVAHGEVCFCLSTYRKLSPMCSPVTSRVPLKSSLTRYSENPFNLKKKTQMTCSASSTQLITWPQARSHSHPDTSTFPSAGPTSVHIWAGGCLLENYKRYTFSVPETASNLPWGRVPNHKRIDGKWNKNSLCQKIALKVYIILMV